MNEPDDRRRSDSWFGLAGVAAVALAIGCCGALPIAVVLASTVAVGTLLGIGAGLIGLIALVAIIVVRARRRAGCAPRTGQVARGVAGRREEASSDRRLHSS